MDFLLRKYEGQGPQSFSNSAVKILRGIEGVGVDLFRFAFYPEGEAMKNFNSSSNQDYFLTKFIHQAAFKDGSALVILEDFATSVFLGISIRFKRISSAISLSLRLD